MIAQRPPPPHPRQTKNSANASKKSLKNTNYTPPAVRHPTRKPESVPNTPWPAVGPKMQILSHYSKDELLIYWSPELSAIYPNLYEEVSPGTYICLFEKKDILFI